MERRSVGLGQETRGGGEVVVHVLRRRETCVFSQRYERSKKLYFGSRRRLGDKQLLVPVSDSQLSPSEKMKWR
jgi:hypothetical protein